ncbi:uncharacterized protein N7500_000010 [Penicillium coprophilum]|uniref:uncharacterized protein n=1 Tax=Penicillium coprophilum TaxID=36646 RepID=UPI0023890EC9|nr:uncharacterized protein N7500_000010 [Penicillium coprophilum]KAJ5177311.1 hypothetical protein N7500_000010 [Penicillium coprophilum]
MKVTIKEWNAVATWHWNIPEDEVCGICRVQFDGTCPTCKFPGDDCALVQGRCNHAFHMRAIARRPHINSSTPGTLEPPCQGLVPDETDDHPDEGQGQPLSHPAFQPFFTLIEDAHTSDYHHPTVHYIFSDDDTDIVTEAALRSLTAQQEAISDSKKDQIAQAQTSNLPDEIKHSDPDQAKTTLLPPPAPGVRENYIILDVEPSPHTSGTAQTSPINEQLAAGKGGSGTRSISSSPANVSALPQEQGQPHPQYRVTAAQSFSPTWQVLRTEVMPAPTFENSNPGESLGHGLMLKIRGTGGLPIEVDDKEKGRTLEEMMDQFAKRMSELQVVIDAAESKEEHNEEELVQHPFAPDTAESTAQNEGNDAVYAAEVEVEQSR